MRVLAIDPGYDRLGIAIIEKEENKEEIIYSECFQTSSKDLFNNRLLLVGNKINETINKYKPDFCAIESLFFSKNTKTALKVSEAKGIIVFQAMNLNIPIYEYTPNQIKVAVAGYGNASKKDMYIMVKKLININKETKQDDEIDAIAIGLTFFASYKNI